MGGSGSGGGVHGELGRARAVLIDGVAEVVIVVVNDVVKDGAGR